ncbi:MAG: DMT family transporter [Flavobacteriaceae bacterium]|nr:DMT family transporter [Flavobacteriaceae bacterium]
MQNDKLKSYLLLHLIVFIAGFTAIIGEIITVGSATLVWYRMLIAAILMYAYIKFMKIDLRISKKTFLQFSLAGIIIALHWITFFEAINQSNISITLAMFSTGAFFGSFIEPIVYKRKLIPYEILLGVFVILGIYLIMKDGIEEINGVILGILSAFLSSLFAVINGKFVATHTASVISFYEFIAGVVFITMYLACINGGFNTEFFNLSQSDWIWLFVLASVCTAFAFIVSVAIMKDISPYTVILSYNLEPIYGFILAVMFFPEKEIMSWTFYLGSGIILITVILNSILKSSKKLNQKSS